MVPLVQAPQEVELSALGGKRKVLVLNVGDELVNLLVLCINVCPLIGSGQESGLPVLGFLDWVSSRAHRDKSRRVLIFCSQSIACPGANTWSDKSGFSAVHQEQGRFVVRNICVHGADHAKLISGFGYVREKFADLQPAFAMPTEFEGRL